jgi:hypothetical protein
MCSTKYGINSEAHCVHFLALQTKAAREESIRAAQRIKPNEPGYRVHASIPQPSKLDYIVAPEPAVDLAAATSKGANNKPLFKKIREVTRKNKI